TPVGKGPCTRKRSPPRPAATASATRTFRTTRAVYFALMTSLRQIAAVVSLALACLSLHPRAQAPAGDAIVLRPAAVFDGGEVHRDWVVVVRGERIEAAGPAGGITVPAGAAT